MTSTETKRPQNGHSETSNVENLSSDLKALDARDYSEHATVYKMRATRTLGGPLHQDVGAAGKALINEGVRLALMMERSLMPLPLELVVRPDSKSLFCGRRFEIEKDATETTLGSRIEEVMEEYGVGFVSVMRNDWDSNVYVTYGHEEPEYWAHVHAVFPSEDEGVF